ncbi:MAG: hypothetical protein IJO43_04940 [Bacilli bacterium]|nr:hypothetical protein [Bacilli bacterium]
MFLKKYLSEFYFNLVINTYNVDYLNSLDENNFIKIFQLFKLYKFYFIDDIVLKYLELFSLDHKMVDDSIINLKNRLGENYIYIIGNNMNYLDEIIENSIGD